MAKKMSEATILKKLRQIMELLAHEILRDHVFAYGQSFDDLAMTESEILKLRRGVEKILGSKFSDEEWKRVEFPIQLFQLAERKMRGPRRP
jgi:hypothetical protein